MLKDIVTIFYEPLAKVYKAANIADSLYDLQLFIGDLIKTVEQAEEGLYSGWTSRGLTSVQRISRIPSARCRSLSTSSHDTRRASTTLCIKCTRRERVSSTT